MIVSLLWLGINVQPAKSDVISPNIDVRQNTNVILLGWDGVQRNHLYELLDKGLLPNLSSLIQNGVIVNETVSDHYTDTKAGWTQILTGYKWLKTGVFSNYLWFNSIPAGYTIPERLKSIYGRDNIVTAFIKGKVDHMETMNETNTASPTSPWSIYTNEAIYSNHPSVVDVVSSGSPDTGVYDPNNDRFADVIGPLTVQFIQNNSRNHFFAFFHFADPDHLGHTYGENSVQYENGIETCDYWLGQIMATLNTLNITQKTLIYLTTDHGFDEGAFTHHYAPFTFLATNDKNVTRNGDEVDIAPTIYYGLGLWNQSFSPALDGYPLQISLPAGEAQKRESIIADTTAIPTPSLSITDGNQGQKNVTFSAKDDNLVAVLLFVDNRLKSSGPWNWTQGEEVIATGSYFINTSGLISGLHTVKILAFDAHGAYNGGVDNYPAGGSPVAMSSTTFYVEDPISTVPPTIWPVPTPTDVPAPTIAPSQVPVPTCTPTPEPKLFPALSSPPADSAPPASSPSPTIPATSPTTAPPQTQTHTPQSTLSPSTSPPNAALSSQSQSGLFSSMPRTSPVNPSAETAFQVQLALLVVAVFASAVVAYAIRRVVIQKRTRY
jgi:hypothetical protein